jgi:hypothetical protein
MFCLAGQGKVRVVRLPDWPQTARWVTLKELPREVTTDDPNTGRVVKTTLYRQSGNVLQAEEVFTRGAWRRYYGFVGSHRVARVPAAEIDFPPEESWPLVHGRWVHLTETHDARLEGPEREAVEWSARIAAGKAVPFVLRVHNRSGLDRSLPDLKRVTLRAWYSPETISPKGMLIPTARWREDWTELKAKPAARLAAMSGPALGPAEERVACRFDVRDGFDLSRPGFYRVQLAGTARKGDTGTETVSEVQFSIAPREEAGPRK